MTPNVRRRPVEETGRRKTTAGEHVETSLTRAADRPALDHATAAHAVHDALVVVVLTAAGHMRRRVYLNLPSASAAAERARARGQDAEVVLCRLQPVEPAAGPREVP